MDIQNNLALVVQTVDSAMRRINLYPLDSAIGFLNTWIVIYPVDSAVQHLNNWGPKICDSSRVHPAT